MNFRIQRVMNFSVDIVVAKGCKEKSFKECWLRKFNGRLEFEIVRFKKILVSDVRRVHGKIKQNKLFGFQTRELHSPSRFYKNDGKLSLEGVFAGSQALRGHTERRKAENLGRA